MSKPTVMQAIEAAKYLRRVAAADSEAHSAVRTLLDYTQSDRWRFGWFLSDFGDIVAHVGPPESFGDFQRHQYDSPDDAVNAAKTVLSEETAADLEDDFKRMGVME